MGKKWDRLDGVGTGGATFTKDGMGKGFKALPSYSGNPNPLCLNCKGSKRGRDRKGFKVCRCSNPSFPNIGKAQGERIHHWHLQWLIEAHRVLEPGGVIKAFSGSRTFHRLATAIETAGFTDIHLEVWSYGSGFPKSLSVSKAIDATMLTGGSHSRNIKTAIAMRPGEGRETATLPNNGIASQNRRGGITNDNIATDEARAWKGWGTALKPSWEPVLVGRKPRG